MRRRLAFGPLAVLLLATAPLAAQQTGSIAGTVSLADGTAAPGVVVEASSPVLPRPRAATTQSNGFYHLQQLPPGDYEVSFTLSGMETVTRQARVALDQQTSVDVTLGIDTVSEAIEVIAEASLIDRSSAELRSGVGAETLELLPVGRDYRDLQKLVPGVTYSELVIRGPSAGGSGQDNTYSFDGVSVNLPMFGTLSAEPSSHDVAQVSMVKGGARAVGFNRAGGFSMDTVSKSGTAQWRGQASYEVQQGDWTADSEDPLETFDEDRDYTTLGIGGPLWRDNLFAYGSYYRPTRERGDRTNVYGRVPDYESTRDELFGKLTWTPTSAVLFNGSYRDSEREDTAASVGSRSAPTTSTGEEVALEIGIAEGSWVINERSLLTFKWTDFANLTRGVPDHLAAVRPSFAPGTRLDIDNLETQGQFIVPEPVAGQDAYNAFIIPFIQRYGYLQNGVRVGGGDVGVEDQFNFQDFYRESYQVGYDFTFGGAVTHELHAGYQYFSDEEDLTRFTNGWGVITVLGGRESFQGQPAFFRGRFLAAGIGETISNMRSEYESHNVELNDTIRWNDWTFNVGVLLSQDTMYGQGLRRDSSASSGFVPERGARYEMYKIDWDELIQPRLAATWAYNGRDTVYASYARYNPATSSLPRAASWDRNFQNLTIDAFFDANGVLMGTNQFGASSGKLFADDLDPRFVDEFVVGSARQLGPRWTARAFGRYRYSANFWEDTNNNARIAFDPPAGVPRELYIQPNNLVGTGSYVIAELDGAFTKYYEATLEAERRADRTFVRGSFTWSHYYGNFDQDNTNGAGVIDNDFNSFIGSSNLADAAGRQVWDRKYGNLRGDRRYLLKVYGTQQLPWNASVGAFAVYQDGQPWEVWDSEAYRHLTSSTSQTIRFAEPAGSRRSDDHYQLDLNYTQGFPVGGRFLVQLVADVYNVFDRQTGYAIDPIVNSSTFGRPTEYYDPRRIRLGVRLEF